MNYLLPFILDKYDGNCILHQDNDGKHTSRLCVATLERYGMTWTRAPAYSPDFNPIEELWAVMKRYVLRKRCQTLVELQEAIVCRSIILFLFKKMFKKL